MIPSKKKEQNRIHPEASIEKDRDRNPSPTTQSLKIKRKVFISGLSVKMTRKGLLGFFKSIYPSVSNFTIKRLGNNTKKLPGYGFLVLTSEEEAQAVLSTKLFYYKGRYLKAEPFLRNAGLKKHQEGLEKKRIFVGRIPANMTSEALWEVMEERIGPVESAFVVSQYKKRKRKKFGYAIFSSEELAEKALQMKLIYLDGYDSTLNLERPKRRGNNLKQLEPEEKKI